MVTFRTPALLRQGCICALLTLPAFTFARTPPKCANNPHGLLKPLPHHTTCSLLLDDDETLLFSRYGPWSFTPACTPSGHTTAPKLCAYTVSNLRSSGAGLSIITAPPVAANLAHNLQDADIAWLEKTRGYALAPSRSDPPFRIKQTGDKTKGMGVFATKPIKKGEVLMAELPIMLRISDLRAWKKVQMYELLQEGSMRLPEREKRRLLGMSRGGEKGEYIVEDIMRTNVFHVVVEGVGHTGLYPDIARINHQCRPNAFVRYSPAALVLEVVAYRDIEAGEEVSLSYLPLNLLSHQRAQLIQTWGFNCSCSLCTDAESTKLSDINRDRIQDILESLDHRENRSPHNIEAAVLEVEDLGTKEGLAGQMGDFYNIIAAVYLEIGDLKGARRYGRLAVKMLQHYAGFDNMRTDAAVEFLKKLG